MSRRAVAACLRGSVSIVRVQSTTSCQRLQRRLRLEDRADRTRRIRLMMALKISIHIIMLFKRIMRTVVARSATAVVGARSRAPALIDQVTRSKPDHVRPYSLRLEEFAPVDSGPCQMADPISAEKRD